MVETALKYSILSTQQREALMALVASKVINQSDHPDASLPYSTFSYSHQCQIDRNWTPETRMARGLIVNRETWEVLARPFDKFFNLGEPQSMSRKDAEKQNHLAPIPGGPAEATIKLDGSLGVSYWAVAHPFDSRPSIFWATRGSFKSEQADVANEMWQGGAHDETSLMNHPEFGEYTLLVEIIAPNCGSQYRLEYPYKNAEGENLHILILIGARHRRNGTDLNHADLTRLAGLINLPVVELVTGHSVAELVALADEIPQEMEGFVLRWPDGTRLKVKGTAWMRAEFAIGGATCHRLLDLWVLGEEKPLLEGLPTLVLRSRQELIATWDIIAANIEKMAREEHITAHRFTQTTTNDQRANRKAFAERVLQVVQPALQPLVFTLYSGKTPNYKEHTQKYVLALEEQAKAQAAGPQQAEVEEFHGYEEIADV